MFCFNSMAPLAPQGEQMRRPRRNHTAAFKAKVALQFDIHPNQITAWKSELLDRATELFSTAAERAASQQGPSVKDLQAKIGQITMENDFLERALGRMDALSAKR
jgi:transposase